MANVIKKKSFQEEIVTSGEYIHRCGEILRIITQGNTIIGYADISGSKVLICPHCLREIEFDDLQIPGNVENFGWPD